MRKVIVAVLAIAFLVGASAPATAALPDDPGYCGNALC